MTGHSVDDALRTDADPGKERRPWAAPCVIVSEVKDATGKLPTTGDFHTGSGLAGS